MVVARHRSPQGRRAHLGLPTPAIAPVGAMLAALCAAVGIDFDQAMLSWEAGPRAEDGVWGEHWYDAIWKSTGFSKPKSLDLPPELPDHLAKIEAEALPAWEAMAGRRIGSPPR